VWRRILAVVATLAYPFAVYLGSARLEARELALLPLALLLLRGFRGPLALLLAVAAVTLAASAAWANSALPLKAYPAVVNLGLLILFAASLVHPPSAIERLARLREPELSAGAVAYTRRVTQVWCVFFAGNGAMAAWTALYASDGLWALYNGLIAYLLIAALLAGEWLVRQRVRARHG